MNICPLKRDVSVAYFEELDGASSPDEQDFSADEDVGGDCEFVLELPQAAEPDARGGGYNLRRRANIAPPHRYCEDI